MSLFGEENIIVRFYTLKKNDKILPLFNKNKYNCVNNIKEEVQLYE